jgi:hypothetical protein
MTPVQVKHGDEFSIGDITVRALATPCHTQDSICFYVEGRLQNCHWLTIMTRGQMLPRISEASSLGRLPQSQSLPTLSGAAIPSSFPAADASSKVSPAYIVQPGLSEMIGKPEEMHKALNETLASLPDDTVVGCGTVWAAALTPTRSTVA